MSESPDSAGRRCVLGTFVTLGIRGVLGAGLVAPARAVRPRADSPEVAIDPLMVDTGLAARWGSTMQRDLGWAARWQPAGTRQVLDRLESGEAEVGLFLSHPRTSHLEKEGLIHDRRRLARTEVWLIGPTDDPAGIRAEKDPGRAIAQVLAAQAAGVASWQAGVPSEPDNPLAQLASQLVGSASLAGSGSQPSPRAQAAAQAPRYQLVTQAGWLRRPAPQGQPGSRIWLQGHPSLVLHAEVARSFRGRHPGGRLLVDWLDRPLARQSVRGAAGWQNAKG